MSAQQTNSHPPDTRTATAAPPSWLRGGPEETPGASAVDPMEPLDTLLAQLRCGTTGLSSADAHARLDDAGPNLLRVNDQRGFLRPLLRQLTHPLALLLWMAAVLAFTTQGPTLGTAIIAVIALNACFALVQERHAQHAVAALSRYLPQHAVVVRDGEAAVVEAATVVPGDLLVVQEGDAICADARLVQGGIEVDLSAITGESVPVSRTATSDVRDWVRIVDADDVLLSGTTCTAGEARALVVRTGMSTELGRIAALSRHTGQQPSPLERQVRHVAWLIAGVAILVGVAFLPLGMIAGLSFTEAAVFGIGLLVANVPEGLLPTITLALAVGVGDMARRGGLVKRLSAIETLGSTDVICTDKTGTLTQNRMAVHSIWGPDAMSVPSHAGDPRALALALRTTTTADPRNGIGDPTDLALLAAARRLDPEGRGLARTTTYAFDARIRLMSVTASSPAGTLVITKGAPEAVVARCTGKVAAVGIEPLTPEQSSRLLHRLDDLASEGLRLIACAQRSLPTETAPTTREEAERDLDLLGFVALTDPVRDAVPGAVEQAHAAGITVHVITGDSGPTAAAIARSAGIRADAAHVVTGTTLDAMSDGQLDRVLARPGQEVVFARSSPEDKLRIARRLQHNGHVVAMTGDGVNDAPALKTADIGVAMGRSGTDVAREAATMVLTDDDFSTIIRAIEAGRRVYDNVRKFILYIFAHAVPEVVPFLVFALSGGRIPLGLTVAQILMIDLGTETLPALALGREASEPGIMNRPPRPRHENLITREMLVRAWGVLGTVSAVLVMSGFVMTLAAAGWSPGDDVGAGSPLHESYLRATTMVFAGIVVCQIGTALAARTDRVSLLRVGVLSNRLLTGGIAFELVVSAAAIYLPPAQHVLGTRPLTWPELLLLATFPPIVWGADEAFRWQRRRTESGVRSGTTGPVGEPPRGTSMSLSTQHRLGKDAHGAVTAITDEPTGLDCYKGVEQPATTMKGTRSA
jgi:calcium-translocating P-type ATPase